MTGNVYRTPGFRETIFRQDQTIHAGKRSLGTVQVFVQPGRGSEAAPAFLDQEADLLGAVAVWVGEIVEQRQSRTQRRLGLETSFLKACKSRGERRTHRTPQRRGAQRG